MTDLLISMARSAATKVLGLLMNPAQEHLTYLLCLTSFVDEFKEATQPLVRSQDHLLNEVKMARWNDEDIDKNVLKWLDDVETILTEAKVLEKEIIERKGCFMYNLSRRIKNMTKQILKLQKEYPAGLVGRRIDLSPLEFSQRNEFNLSHSSKEALYNIIDSLKSDNVNMIGLYGMGGVGKTRLVKHIGQIAIQDQLFDKVLMLVFSLNPDTQRPDITKIQDKIAFELNLNIDSEKNETARANRLLSRLKQEKSILIVLDDVCSPVQLREIGLEYDPSQKKCKYILTTHDSHICGLMGCQKVVHLDIMTESEALVLLKKNTGLNDEDSQKADIASKVAKKCGGLPIAIVTLASALKDKSSSQWEAALNKLNKSKLLNIDHIDGNRNPYTCFRSSYDQLNNKDLKLCFLLCSLYPEDYDISREDLTRLAATELESDGSIEEKRILVEASMDTLIAKSLLLKSGGEGKRKVKLHYMVRHFALWILSNPENFFTGTYISESGGYPTNDVLALYMAVLIMKNQNKELPSGLIYQKLRVLHIHGQDRKSISNDVLTVLTNLRALYLEEWGLLSDIPSLRNLKNIEILSFRGSSISQLPDGISELSDLKLLDVSNCRHLIKIPHGLLKNLLNLEELYTHGSQDNLWRVEIGEAHLSELKPLTRLNIFSLEVRREQLVEGFILSKFESDETTKSIMILFNSSRGDSDSDILRIENADSTWMNALGKWELKSLPEIRCVLEGPTPIVPFANLTEISIEWCLRLTFVFSQSLARSLVQLQKLKIHYCSFLKHIIMEEDGNVTSMNHNQPPCFKKLEILDISNCPELICIIKEDDGNASSWDHNQPPCFGQLERLKISNCPKLKYIMSVAMARHLDKLEYLLMGYVNSGLKQIFGPEEEEGSSREIVLPRLKELRYNKSDHINRIICPSLQTLDIMRCYERDLNRLINGKQLESLKLSYIKDTWYYVLAMLVKQPLPTLKHIHLKFFRELQPIFHLEGLDDGQPHLIVSIESLRLDYVSDLRDIWSGCIYTPNLTHLKISFCTSLRYIFSPTLAKSLPLLKILQISQSNELVTLIGGDNAGESDRPNHTYFPNLEHISISKCQKLKYLFPISFALGGLSKLSSLSVKLNFKLEAIFEGVKEVDDKKILVLPLLVKMKLYDLPMLKSFSPVGYHFIFPRLEYLAVTNCDNLATNFTFVSSDTSVHGETKDDSKRLGSGFLYKYKKEDLHSYLNDGSFSQDPQSLKIQHEDPERLKKDKICSVMGY